MTRPAWRVVGRSVRGASHLRSGLPNQDALGFLPEGGAGLPLIVAVSDGHGSAKSFRSDTGARLAVAAVMSELGQIVEGAGEPSLAAVKRLTDEHLARAVVRRWERDVRRHLEETPFTPEELDGLEKREGVSARQKVEKNLCLAYGATVLAAVVARSFLLYLQLGDGDIITVSEAGEAERPLVRDERLMANETTSLCSHDAEREVRIVFRPIGAGGAAPPALILVSTDGYANSFRDETGFLKVGPDILEMLATDGVDRVAAELDGWLADASKVGSGDDITLALVVCEDALPACRRRIALDVTDPAPPSAT